MCEDSENQKTLKTSLYIAIIYTFQKHSSDHVGSRSRSSGKNSEAGVDMCAVTSGTFQNLAGSSRWSSYDSGHFSISETKFS